MDSHIKINYGLASSEHEARNKGYHYLIENDIKPDAKNGFKQVDQLNEKYPGLLGTPISDLGLSTRTFDALFGFVSTVRELLQYSPGEYSLFPGIGPVGCMEIRRGLEYILNRFGVSEISME